MIEDDPVLDTLVASCGVVRGAGADTAIAVFGAEVTVSALVALAATLGAEVGVEKADLIELCGRIFDMQKRSREATAN